MMKEICRYVFIGLIVMLSGIDFAEAVPPTEYYSKCGTIEKIQLDLAEAKDQGDNVALDKLNKCIYNICSQEAEQIYRYVIKKDGLIKLKIRIKMLASIVKLRPNVAKYQNALEQLKREVTYKR